MAESQPTDVPPEEQLEPDSEPEEQAEQGTTEATGETAGKPKKKKKKSKKSKLVSALTGTKPSEQADPSKPLSNDVVKTLLDANPALKGELAGMPPEKAGELLKKMDVSQLLSGLSITGKNQKDMASYKFWATQPV